MQTERIVVSDVALNVTTDGEGDPVVLLHGFPEFSLTWRHVIPRLVAAGHRVIAPDLRGYNLSDRPEDTDRYSLSHLVSDVVGLARALDLPTIKLVGHDWGGMIAYAVAANHPDLVEKLVIVNAAHPALLKKGLHHPSQLIRSWYLFFFQLPGLPEELVASRTYLLSVLQGERPEAFPEEILERYVAAMQRPGAAAAGIAYYRAAARHGMDIPTPIRVPTRVVWGDGDEALSKWLCDGLDAYVPGVEITHVPGSSHWLQEDDPDALCREIVPFFA